MPGRRGRRPSSAASRPPPGKQAQVDFAQFRVEFTDEPGVVRILWLFTIILGPQPLALGPVLRDAGSADRPALPYRRLRRHGRRAVRAALRPHEDGGDRRGRQRRRPVQRLARRAAQPLRRHAARLPALSGQDEGQDRAAVPLRPAGLLAGAQLPQPRRSQRPVRRLAHADRQPQGARHHPPGRRPALRRGAAGADRASCHPLQRRADHRAARQPRGHGLGGRQSLQRARHRQKARPRRAEPSQRGAHLRGRRADRRASGAGGQEPAPRRSRAPQGAAARDRSSAAPPTGVGVRPLSFYDAVARRLAGEGAAR